MATLLLQQGPGGNWFASAVDGGARFDDIAGWNQLGNLVAEHEVQWQPPQAVARFRAQFGEPPAGFDAERMSVATST